MPQLLELILITFWSSKADLIATRVFVENENAHNQIFNLTYGEGRSLADMVSIMKEQFPDLKIEYQPKDKLTPDRGTLSVEKAKKLIGYNPQFPLDKGYVDYIGWYQEFWDSRK